MVRCHAGDLELGDFPVGCFPRFDSDARAVLDKRVQHRKYGVVPHFLQRWLFAAFHFHDNRETISFFVLMATPFSSIVALDFGTADQSYATC